MLDLTFNKNIKSNLLKTTISLDNLLISAQNALRSKLSHPRFFDYYYYLGSNIHKLCSKLHSNTYTPSFTKEFDLWCISGQKMRHINVPILDDLIVQHAIYRVLMPVVEPKLIFDSYGCRKNKGTHKAADRCQFFLRKSNPASYYLQLDIRKYYYNIDHTIVKSSLYHLTKDLEFTDFIVEQFPLEQEKGMYVGTLLAQVMGIIYLNPLDHFIKRVLKCQYYIRYVDDLLIIGESKERCLFLKKKIEEFLFKDLKLTLSKFKISPVKKGINFVGYKTWQTKRFIRKRSLKVFNKNLRKRKKLSLQSGLAHALHTTSYTSLKKKVEDLGYKVENSKILN